MKMNYQKEYYRVVKDIKYKLSKLYLNKDIESKYRRRLINIDKNITDRSDIDEYYEAFEKAIFLEEELDKLIKKHPELILPPYENKDYLKNHIHELHEKLKESDANKESLAVKLITYVLTGLLLISAGAYALTRDKDKTKEKLYLTTETTYNVSKDKTRHTYKYEKADEHINRVVIKEVTPWVVGEKEATRYERYYYINNFTYGEIISRNNYEEIIANLTYEEKVDTMSLAAYTGTMKYTEPLYEVIETYQDKSNYIEKSSPISKEAVAILFADLLVYMLALGLNNGPLIDSIVKTIKEISATSKITSYQESTLKLLKTQVKTLKRK